MAYLIFADRKGELARHALEGPVIVGRSVECSIAVHDALLSRRHCRIEPVIDQWVITDLESKNGTRVDGKAITRHTLADGDVVRIGRTQVCFRAGKFIPAPPANRPADFRPLDPIEALAGTVAGFRLEAEPIVDVTNFPRPQPKPAEARTSSAEEAQSLITGLSSSSWDDLIASGDSTRAGTRRPRPKVAIKDDATAKHAARPRAHVGRLLALAGAAVTLVVAAILLVRHF